jgi:hypothetical protein
MKLLDKYSKNGYDFEIIEKKGSWAIALGIGKVTGRENWEIIEIQSHTGLMMGNNWVEACEYPPNSKSWGTKGFTADNAQRAEEIFARQINKELNKIEKQKNESK